MIVLPAGEYMMGATEEEFKGYEDFKFLYMGETPRHRVRIGSFALARYAITKRQFRLFAGEEKFEGMGCYVSNGDEIRFDPKADWEHPGFRQTEDDPVVCISRVDVNEFISWLNKRANPGRAVQYRLPSEEEWEYAARAGTTTPMYWGEDRGQQCKHENARDLTFSAIAPGVKPRIDYVDCTDGYIYTSPVGSFNPNQWGLYDMLGNVLQMVGGCSNSLGYDPPPMSNSCMNMNARGGSWVTRPFAIRAASRWGYSPTYRGNMLGFRLAADL